MLKWYDSDFLLWGTAPGTFWKCALVRESGSQPCWWKSFSFHSLWHVLMPEYSVGSVPSASKVSYKKLAHFKCVVVYSITLLLAIFKKHPNKIFQLNHKNQWQIISIILFPQYVMEQERKSWKEVQNYLPNGSGTWHMLYLSSSY